MNKLPVNNMNVPTVPRMFFRFALFALACLASACAPLERIPSREMGVTMGPELVFDRPVEQIFPQMTTAVPTGDNGRVGNEMVFWGYRLQDNTSANLFACAMLEDVNCEARIRNVCPAGGEELARVMEPGKVRHLDCRAFGVAGIGDLRPNCDDYTRDNDLMVGLMQCR